MIVSGLTDHINPLRNGD